MAASDYEPSPRFDHFSTGEEGLMYIWGGRTNDIYKKKRELASTLEIFDFRKEKWKREHTKRAPPPWLHGGVSALSKHHLFIYGGEKSGESYHPSLYQLDRKKLGWEKLPDGPLNKYGSSMIFYQNKIIFFGGYGIPNKYTQRSEFMVDDYYTNGRGWTNQLSTFDLNTGTVYILCTYNYLGCGM